MKRIVGVRFKRLGKIYFFDPKWLEVAKGDKVTLVGFGSWEPRKRAARTGRNPQTGEAIVIPAHTAVTFKAGKGLKDCVNA